MGKEGGSGEGDEGCGAGVGSGTEETLVMKMLKSNPLASNSVCSNHCPRT